MNPSNIPDCGTQLTVSRALTFRYVIALLLLAMFSTAAWISLHLVISEQKSTAAVVNMSGRQRMLSQQVVMYSNLLANAPKAERPFIRGKLKEVVDLMARSHHALTHGDKEMALPDTMSPAVRAMYYDDPNALDTQVNSYIDTVHGLLQLDDDALMSQSPLLQSINKTAPTTLVSALDRMVNLYQLEGETSIGRLQKAETIFWILTLLLLLMEAALIFRPFAKHIRLIIGKLQDVTGELQLHQNNLESLVKQRTAELESKRNELAESEYRYRTLIENVPFCIHEIGLDGRLQSMNHAGLDMLGLKDEKTICGVPYLSSVSEQDSARIRALLQDAINGTPSHFEFSAAGSNHIHFKSCFIPIKDADSKVVKLMGLTEDITEQKQVERMRLAGEVLLREQKEFLAAIFENALDAVVLMNSKGVITGWSHQAESIFGWPREEAVGRLMHETIMPPRYRDRHIRGVENFLLTGEGARLNTLLEMVALHRDGHEFPIEMSISPIKKADGYEFSSFMRDITERKHMERQLQEREELFRAIFEQAPNAIELIDPENLRFVGVNPAACRMLGYTHEEFLQLRLPDTQSDMNETMLIEAVQQVATSGGGTFKNRHRCKNGDILDVEISSRMLDLSDRRLLVGVWRDITESKHAEELLFRQKQFSDDIINSLPGIFYTLDIEGRFVRINTHFVEVSGYTKDELDSMSALDFFEGEDRALITQGMQEVFEKGKAYAEADFIVKGGHKIPYSFTGHRTNIDGEFYLVGLGTDITERRRAEENLRITASVFDTSQEGILIADANNAIVDVNPAFTRITGYSREEVLGRNPKLLSSGRQGRSFYAAMWQSLQQDKVWRGEIWNRRKSGEVYAELLSISSICDDDGKVQRNVAVFSDISNIKDHEAELSRIAHYDALTGIPNRVLLADRMKQAVAHAAREGEMMAVCYLDLDGFKPINDTLGHEAGDQVLIEIAKRIGSTIRGGDTAARLGGDEFVVLLLGIKKGEECVATMERLLAAIAQPISVNGNQITLGASIGVSIYPLDNNDPDTLLRHADQSMYIAKKSGKNRFYIYDAALDLRTRNQQELLQSIHRGVESNQFTLHYQPKINLHTKQLVGAEALIRWRHPVRGLLPPAEFLHHIEKTELDIKIGDWVIATALAQMDIWQQAGKDIEVSINISAYHLESPNFAEKLRMQLANYPDLRPGKFQIEVLETVALKDISIVRDIVDACRKFGVSFALDDFGTGYSSLSHLSNLPIDVLKIDQSFVRDMLKSKGDMSIVQGVIALAQAFELQTVAEGVETPSHYQVLLEMGCDVGQGYCIAHPMSADELQNWHAG